eukprot:GHRR01028618.1.p1 GENE.GHRR01028618.1~~GHRR01028618.1.p1  ORF type:complete len:187 (+),score=34.47 GHRR01028618.1:847-1407(+)
MQNVLIFPSLTQIKQYALLSRLASCVESTHTFPAVLQIAAISSDNFYRISWHQHLSRLLLSRCGEWAHTFLLVLRAAGLDARHVSDSADHVWCEYYSASLGRWVHVDSCEQSWDQALLYEGGWGKKLAYVFAASRHGVADVTRCEPVLSQVLCPGMQGVSNNHGKGMLHVRNCGSSHCYLRRVGRG